MKTRITSWLPAAIVAVALAITAAPAPAPAWAAGVETTEDILFMEDGRELHGQIVSETPKVLVFEVVDRRLELRSTVTLLKSEISLIKRDVALPGESEGAPAAPAKPAPVAPDKAKPGAVTFRDSRFGKNRYSSEMQVPSVYVVPMKGQLGTDIHPAIYRKVVDDIREVKPDAIVIVMDCKDKDDLLIPLNEATEQGLFLHHEYREIVDMFRDGLADVPQVMWVEDSVGFPSLLAMAWPKIYMTPTARLGGLNLVAARAGGWSDPDVAAKMLAAWTGIGRGFLENGGYPVELAEAMMRAEYDLSASFKGREVIWSLNKDGEFLVDDSEKTTPGFRSKIAEDLLISQGTCDNLDDLAFLLGYREFRLASGQGEAIVEGYKAKWRAAYDKTVELYKDYGEHQNWANGDEEVKFLGAAMRDLDQIVKLMEVYPAVETRWRTDYGQTKQNLKVRIEQIKEQLIALKQGRRGGAGGGGYGGGRGMGGG